MTDDDIFASILGQLGGLESRAQIAENGFLVSYISAVTDGLLLAASIYDKDGIAGDNWASRVAEINNVLKALKSSAVVDVKPAASQDSDPE